MSRFFIAVLLETLSLGDVAVAPRVGEKLADRIPGLRVVFHLDPSFLQTVLEPWYSGVKVTSAGAPATSALPPSRASKPSVKTKTAGWVAIGIRHREAVSHLEGAEVPAAWHLDVSEQPAISVTVRLRRIGYQGYPPAHKPLQQDLGRMRPTLIS
jgi:hypothetical protein